MAGQAEMMCEHGAGDKVLQLKTLDPFGFSEFYGVTEMFDNTGELLLRAIELEPEYDYLIVHDYNQFIEHFPANKIILVYHGTKLRYMPESEKGLLIKSGYPIYVTTHDLLECIPATLLPNMVDLEHFVDVKPTFEADGDWFCINRTYQREYIEKRIKEKYPKTEYYERSSKNIIDYEDMPHFLEQHSNYVDWKFNYDKPEPHTTDAMSCTGLQAMAVGCTVHNSNGEVNKGNLLAIHDAKRVTERFLKDYAN